jgi:hypothetical protein
MLSRVLVMQHRNPVHHQLPNLRAWCSPGSWNPEHAPVRINRSQRSISFGKNGMHCNQPGPGDASIIP